MHITHVFNAHPLRLRRSFLPGIFNQKQKFLDSEEVTYIRESDCLYSDKNMIYLIHPALTKSIEKKIVHKNILHFKGFIVGKNLMVSKDILQQLLKDRDNLSVDEFDKKYYGNNEEYL